MDAGVQNVTTIDSTFVIEILFELQKGELGPYMIHSDKKSGRNNSNS